MATMAPLWGAHAQGSPAPVSEGRVAAYTAATASIQLATVLESFLYEREYFPYLLLGTATVQGLPALFAGAEPARINAAVQLGLDAVYAGSALVFGEHPGTPLLFNAAHKYSMFASYDSYASLRSSAGYGGYGGYGDEDRHSFLELASAPFDYRAYAHWSVAGFVGSMGAYSLISMLSVDRPDAVWSTGEAYIGDYRFSPWAGVALILLLQVPNFVLTGVGEEALYRGVYYEELAYRLGEWPAKLIDGAYFTLSHYPQRWDEIASSPTGEVIMTSLLSMAQAFWFQYIYEWRGLRSAVAAHAAADVIVFFCDWLAQAGVPNRSGFSIGERALSIGVTLRL